MSWKESLTIKGSAIYQLTNCSCIFLHYLIELLHTSNIILRLYVSVIIRIDCYVWLECMVKINEITYSGKMDALLRVVVARCEQPMEIVYEHEYLKRREHFFLEIPNYKYRCRCSKKQTIVTMKIIANSSRHNTHVMRTVKWAVEKGSK